MENNNHERRSEQRLTETVTILLERYAAEFDNSHPASIVICRSLDISANGLQVRIDEPIPVGTILRLDRKSTRLNSSHIEPSRMPSSA